MKKSYAVIAGIALLALVIVIGMQINSDSTNVKTFTSQDQLLAFLNAQTGTDTMYGGRATTMAESSADNSKSDTPAPADGTGSYSTTNNQVSNVDEPDFVKNDGNYIYIASNTNLTILAAQPTKETRILSITDVNGSINEISLYQNTLVVMGSENYYYPTLYDEAQDRVVADKAQIIRPYYQPRSFVKIYNIANRENPKLINTLIYDGSYYDARLINSYLYIITNQQLINGNDAISMPSTSYGGTEDKIAASDISYFPMPDYGYQLTTIFTLDLSDTETEPSRASFLTGYSQTLYVSQDNMYFTAPKYVSYNDYNKRLIESVLLPSLDIKNRAAAEVVIAGDEEWYMKEEMISVIVSDYYNTLSESEKNEFESELSDNMADFQSDWQADTQKTTIHKISLDGMDVEYESRGEVPGHLLNQFSLDEHDNTLRVATTTSASFGGGIPIPFTAVARAAEAGVSVDGTSSSDDSTSSSDNDEPAQSEETPAPDFTEPITFPAIESQSSNNIYVLDDNLNIIGSLTDLAQGERIYSARFINDRAYLVTFKQVDPLFVIDLSNPRNPKVLGELKIPGFSTYLHPYNEDIIIGIGQDTDGEISEADSLAAIPAGLKIALFDVSDPENPVELDKYILGDRGTYSDALYEHKAFFFDKETNTLVLPVNVQERTHSNAQPEDQFWYPTRTIFQGAYVFDLSEETIEVKGTITHLNASEISQMNQAKDYYYPSYDTNIQRTLLINNALYTISQRQVQASDIDTLDTIKRVALPNPYSYYYGWEAAV